MSTGNDFSFSVSSASENTLFIQFHLADGEQPSSLLATHLAQCVNTLWQGWSPYIVDIVPSYTSIIIYYNFLSVSAEQLISEIESAFNKITEDDQVNSPAGKIVEVPTLYNESTGPDLARLAKEKQCSVEHIIRLHSEKEYNVFALGFAPGFPYLGFVNEILATPRLTSPRTQVAKGSVGIADAQTGIYPNASPGGWNLIGQTPFSILHTHSSEKPSSPFTVGDRVRFVPISQSEFNRMQGKPL